MKSLKSGKSISAVSVENITKNGIWLLINQKEYFLDFEVFPYFEDATIKAINNVKLLHGSHLYWKDLDVDLEIDNLEHNENYPLISHKKRYRQHFQENLFNLQFPSAC
jgi:hypothetical protein